MISRDRIAQPSVAAILNAGCAVRSGATSAAMPPRESASNASIGSTGPAPSSSKRRATSSGVSVAGKRCVILTLDDRSLCRTSAADAQEPSQIWGVEEQVSFSSYSRRGSKCALESSLLLLLRGCLLQRRYWRKPPRPQPKSLRRVAILHHQARLRAMPTQKLRRRQVWKRARFCHRQVGTPIPPPRRCRATENQWRCDPIVHLKRRNRPEIGPRPRPFSGCLFLRVWKEKLLAVDLIGRNSALTFG